MTPVMQDVRYLNVDLEIESKSDLSKIVEEFGDDVSVLYCGEMRGYQHASFEISANIADADETINHFCLLVEGLPKDAREDVGFESGTSPQNFRSEIRASTVQRVAAIGASIIITIYPVSDDP
jgi:hypothetical protein